MKILKNKKFTRRSAIILAGTLIFTTVVYGSTITKKIDATFRGIKVFYNNDQKTMAQEPFIYNGSVYLPVRGVGELVDKNIQWDSARNAVFVSDKGAAVPSTVIQQLQSEIDSKNFEIARINAEKSLLEGKIKELEGNYKRGSDSRSSDSKGSRSKGSIRDTEKYLEKEFDYEHDINWELSLKESGSRINVEASYDSRTDGRSWDRLTKSKKEKFFKDISREIRADFKDTTINGKVIDSRTNKTVGSFSYSRSNSFSYSDYGTSSFTDLERSLKKYAKKVDGTEIPVDNISVKGNEDDITFTVYVDLHNRTLKDKWRNAMEDNPREIRQLMDYIDEEIKDEFRYAEVQGFIEDLSTRNTLAKYDGKRLYE